MSRDARSCHARQNSALLLLSAVLCLVSSSHAFKIAFLPGNSTFYVPQNSKTFAPVPQQAFFLGYADNTHLKGFQARDVVQLGDYYTYTKFGAVTDCNSPDFNNVDGILGFGLPVAAPPPPPPSMNQGGGNGGLGGIIGGGIGNAMGGGMGGAMGSPPPPPKLPKPLLFSLTDPIVKDNANNRMLGKRAFAFLSTEDKAEVQLGGYDPASVDGEMFVTPSISMGDYTTVAMGLRYGKTNLMEFTSTNKRLAYVPAIMDSGTSCLVMPGSTLGGQLKKSPFDTWKAMIGGNTKKPSSKDSFFVNIGGAEFEIPYDTWYLPQSNQSCVQRTPPGFPGLLVGDVLFRRYVVMFDLTLFPQRVLIGIGKRKAGYEPGSPHPVVKKIPAVKTAGKGPKAQYHAPLATDTIPIWNQLETQYFINVSVGTPRQQFTVIFDTGSSVFGVFSRCDPHAPVLGECMFGYVDGLAEKQGIWGAVKTPHVSLMNGVIMVVSVAFGLCLAGVGVTLWFRSRHNKDEQERLQEYKRLGGKSSNSGYGPERLYGAV